MKLPVNNHKKEPRFDSLDFDLNTWFRAGKGCQDFRGTERATRPYPAVDTYITLHTLGVPPSHQSWEERGRCRSQVLATNNLDLVWLYFLTAITLVENQCISYSLFIDYIESERKEELTV